MESKFYTLLIAVAFIFSTPSKAIAGEGNGLKKLSKYESSQNWGIGIRLGDPTGLTVKKYFGSNAFELSLGRTHFIGKRGFWNSYYRDKWEDKYCRPEYDDCQFIGYKSSQPLGAQLHYLWHFNFGDVQGLSWYLGCGGQFGFQIVSYDYRYRYDGGPWIYDYGGTFLDLDFGVDGVAGMEYTFANAPFSVFLDVTLFAEVYDRPFLMWFQGGIGGRYNF